MLNNKYIIRLSFLIILISTLRVSGQSQISFAPKMLFREIQKQCGRPLQKLDEIILKDSFYAPNSSGKFFRSENTEPVRYVYMGRVNSCRAGGCSRETETLSNGAYEYFDYFTLYDSNARILLVRVHNYEATHGQEITVKKWLSQFIGYNGTNELIVGKNIDAISGATISVYGITEDISSRQSILKNHLNKNPYTNLSGQIQGTTYSISFKNTENINIKPAIDSIFNLIDTTFSHYNSNSIVSRINANKPDVKLTPLFIRLLALSDSLSRLTEGAFDITAARGTQFSYRDISIQNNVLHKSDTAIKLDFNAIAQGFTTDLIAAFFEKHAIFDYLVEIGGEVRCNGKNQNQTSWVIGIDSPNPDTLNERTLMQETFMLNNRAIATSGNYRKPNHIINPVTGLSAKNELLSVSIISSQCAVSDALATACMVMGLEKSQEFLTKNPNVEACILYHDQNGVVKIFRTNKTI